MGSSSSRYIERRRWPRFYMRIPIAVFVGDRALPGHARNVSDRGVYFYLSAAESKRIEGNFPFVLKLPPEMTSSTWCSVRGLARVVRKDFTLAGFAGIGAEILEYSIVRSGSSANPTPGDPPGSS